MKKIAHIAYYEMIWNFKVGNIFVNTCKKNAYTAYNEMLWNV